ncbi:hypothetical protein KFK09_024242 [Dendrobium nobile]|uniref:Reverse transcriptase domain-containing protein n=1 Tax=Dendrobium nobile TaxID=94219 RepID=A0A8T3ADG2_DENNO|nr:hypothetical protein KFK09_024242 [Dendrobium nobile]
MIPPRMASWNIRGFNSASKVMSCKSLVNKFKLDLLFILEAKISANAVLDDWFSISHKVFPVEGSFNNFSFSSPGRIWVKWNADKVHFKPLFTSSQVIHGVIQAENMDICCISVIYASNFISERHLLWEKVASLVSNESLPCAILGDFNCCISPSDKVGGLPLQHSKMGELNNFVFNAAVSELPSVGHFFTWFNHRLDNPIHIKLDRTFINDAWLSCFPNSYYIVSEPDVSDHCPIILNLDHPTTNKHRFLFKNYWCTLPAFWKSVLDIFSSPPTGSPICDLYHKLRELKCQIKHSNWISSNFIKDKMETLAQAQTDILQCLQNDPLNTDLNAMLLSTNLELSENKARWVDWISQRSKARWLKDGEDDLKFLYSNINCRSNANQIRGITVNGVLLNTCDDISMAFINHFQQLFNGAPPMGNNSLPIGNTIPYDLVNGLTSPFTMEEIKHVIFSSPSSAAPGPDGFPFEFYKSTWNSIGNYICKAVLSFFDTSFLPRQAKNTAIALIPKHQHPTSINDFRPISLCNSFYKIIAKLLANRMKTVMPHIIHPAQAGFIQHRIISDNIILASEILSKFNSSPREKYFCAKFDIHKAFDSISRDFILQRLQAKGFPSIFISWIKSCISDVHFSVAINGSLEGFFSSSSGLRQGCPLSPYLFTVAMDALSCIFDEACHSLNFQGFKMGNLAIHHLLYADDLLVFSKANLQEASCLHDILNRFGISSGLVVNPAKSTILFSNNCRQSEDICDILNIQQTSRPFKYLGLPIHHKKLTFADFQPLISKITKALDGCKAKALSFGGRIQFLRYTIFNTIAYWIRGSIIPKKCFKYLDRLCSRFLYSRDIAAKKLRLIAWKDTCIPKMNGGIGLPSFDALNFTFSCSIIWRFINDSNLLFCCWRNLYTSLWFPHNKACSLFWNKISVIAAQIKHCLNFRILPNSHHSIFWDPWCHGKSISELAVSNLGGCWLDNLNKNSVSTILLNGSWNLPNGWPYAITTIINSVPISSAATGCFWSHSEKVTNKIFRKEFYIHYPVMDWYHFVWHKHSVIRYSAFGWLAVKNGLKTADILIRRGITVNPLCIFCLMSNESHSHLFFECDYSFKILCALIPQAHSLLLRPNIHQMFHFLDDISASSEFLNFYCLVVNTAIYYTWRARNDRIFGNKIDCHTTVVRKIKYAALAKLGRWKNGSNLLHLLG